MKANPTPIDLKKVRVFPLAQRRSLSALDSMLVRPESTPADCSAELQEAVNGCVAQIRNARQRDASVMLIYGAHLIKNGAMAIVIQLIEQGWITHLATNGAGTGISARAATPRREGSWRTRSSRRCWRAPGAKRTRRCCRRWRAAPDPASQQ